MVTDSSMDRDLLQRLESLLNSRLEEEKFGVSELAREIGLSKSQLLRKLQFLKGKSTSQFIREYRLKRAMELLQQGAGTASEIAYRVGFSSPTYFSSCFHEFFGYPPGEVKFRLNIQQEYVHSVQEIPLKKVNTRRTKLMLLLGVLLLITTSFIIYWIIRTPEGLQTNSTSILSEVAGKKSIAVLPVTNLSGEKEFEYISDGMTDEIITQLTKIKSFGRVIPSTTMMSYKKTNKSVTEIARELGVTHLLEGNLQKAGDTVQVVLRLIDGKANTYDWSDNFKSAWEIEDLFKMQSEVAENVARNMNISLTSEDRESLEQLPTLNTEAYKNYQQAEYQRVKGDFLSFKNAIPLYEMAISLDPNYIEAYMGLAYVWMMQGFWWGTLKENEAWRKSREILQTILKMEPSNKEAEYNLYMGYFYYDWNFELVEPYFDQNRRLPVYGDCSWLAAYAQKTGRWNEALRITEAFIDWEPMIGKHYVEKANILFHLGLTTEASEIIQYADSLYSDNFYYLRGSALIYYELKDYKKSRSRLDLIYKRYMDRPPGLLWLNTMLLIQEGRDQESQKQLKEIQHLYEMGAGGSPAYYMALYYCMLEDYEKTFEWLAKSYERREVELTGLLDTPALNSVSKDPRYRDLLDKVGFTNVIRL